MTDATSERARECMRYMGEHRSPPPDRSYMDEPVQVGDRVLRLGDMGPEDFRQFAREERARAFTDLTRPSES
jgi:hypothetical protein